MPMQSIALFFLVAVAIGGVAWVFLFPRLSGERQAEKRREMAARSTAAARVPAVRGVSARARRDQIEGTLKELEERRLKARKVPLSKRIEYAGLDWSKRRFFITAATAGVMTFLISLGILGLGLIPSLGLGFAGGGGVPFWVLSFLRKRREARFLEAFPDSVDIIVRGIRAGLPLVDSLRIITTESPEPIRSEFRAIVETQAIGIPLGEACAKLYERVPLPEANFFGIVVTIQQRAGGNLSEALGNLSKVLRDRKRMKAKIQALSMEAKASAAIIGALPIAVMLLVYITSPDYIELLWTESLGRMMLAGSVAWMTMGILVMRKMINFDF